LLVVVVPLGGKLRRLIAPFLLGHESLLLLVGR
jgi:hypothetical protein